MLIYTVDDEKTALEELTDAVRQVLPNAQIRQFGRAEEALSCVWNDGENRMSCSPISVCPERTGWSLRLP